VPKVTAKYFSNILLENLPAVEKQHVLSPFGEIVANEDFPKQHKEKATSIS